MDNIIKCSVSGHEILLCIDDLNVTADDLKKTNTELWRAQRYSDYESDTIEWIEYNFMKGDVIYDIGANIGQYSLYAAKKLQNDCQIFAFEPEALNYAKLNKNIVVNKLSEIIIPYCLAITDKTQMDFLYIHSFVPGAAFHSFGNAIKQGGNDFVPKHKQGMVGISLDDIVGKFDLPCPNHIKVDVDGSECMVVKGGYNVLEDVRLKSVMIEIYLKKGLDDLAVIKEAFLQRNFILANENTIEYKIGTAPNFLFKRKK